MSKTIHLYLVWIRSKDDGTLTPVYETALSPKEAAHIVQMSIDEEHEQIDDVYRKVNWR